MASKIFLKLNGSVGSLQEDKIKFFFTRVGKGILCLNEDRVCAPDFQSLSSEFSLRQAIFAL